MSDRANEMRCEFMEKHRNAHCVVYDTRTRRPIGAIYYAPDYFVMPEVHEAELKRFFALVRQVEFERQLEVRDVQQR